MSADAIFPDPEIALLRLFYSGRENLRAPLSLTELSSRLQMPGRWRYYEGRQLRLPQSEIEVKNALGVLISCGLISTSDGSYVTTENTLEQIVQKGNAQPVEPIIITPIPGGFRVLGLSMFQPEPEQPIDPSRWTGAELVLADKKNIEKLKVLSVKLQKSVYDHKFDVNSDCHDLRCLCDALVHIVDMTEPQIPLIDKITNHPVFKRYAKVFVFVSTIRGFLGL